MADPRQNEAWTRLATAWRKTMPDGFADRHQLMRDLVTVFPPDHPEAAVLREMLCHLDQFALLQRELPFNPAH